MPDRSLHQDMSRVPLRIWRGFSAAVLLSGAWVAAPGYAQALDDQFWAQIAGYRPNIDSEAQIGSEEFGIEGTEFDFEEDLDLADRKTLPAFMAGARFGGGRKWQVVAEYYALDRSGSRTLDRDITIDNVTYPASGIIESGLDSNIYRLTVGYSFVRNEKVELGAALGAHMTDFTLSFEGTGTVGGGTFQTEVRRRKAFAPLPTIGIYGSFEILPSLTLGARIDYLSLKIDDYDGELINTQATIEYRVTRNFGIGAMYRYVDYKLGVDKPNWQGRVEYQFNGPALYLELGF